MIKVKEYLDKYLFQCGECTAELRSNGHYCVHGGWEYPKGICKSEGERFSRLNKIDRYMTNWKSKDQMSFNINNETISIRMIIINGKSVSKYSYLQTYEHLPRIGPDENGYYVRSTDEEVIKYIDKFYKIISRKEKLKILNAKYNEIY